MALTIMRIRKVRGHHFTARLFADPAWDMLLDLYVTGERQRPVAVSELGLAADIPPTTALRWVEKLQTERLIQRVRDPADARRKHVRLTPSAKMAMDDYLRQVLNGG